MLYTSGMQKHLFGIFAHPDDEAFGPSGTLYKEAQAGTKVHLICVTDGDAGVNLDKHNDLGEIRLQEWKESARLIGATTMNALHYPDSKLSNQLFHEVENAINDQITEVIKTAQKPCQLDFMTFDPGGLSGHIDHIVISMITSHLYYKLRLAPPEGCEVGRLRYFCLSQDTHPDPNTSWIFMPAGRAKELIDETVDVSDAPKVEIMKTHYSQRNDMNSILQSPAALEREHFWFAK